MSASILEWREDLDITLDYHPSERPRAVVASRKATPRLVCVPSDYDTISRDFTDIAEAKNGLRFEKPDAAVAPEEADSTPDFSSARFAKWSIWDFLIVIGTFLLMSGLLVPLLSKPKGWSVLAPLGAMTIALGGYMGREHRTSDLARTEDGEGG